MKGLKSLFGLASNLKLDSIVNKATTNAKHRKFAKLAVRVIQIGVAVYLLKEGLISDDDALDVIKGE